MEPTITVTPRGDERISNGHFWVYRGDVADGRAEPGAVVRVNGPNGRFLARAFYSDRSQITLRILTRHDVPVDRAFWRSRLQQAMAFRETLGIDANAYRLVHGEGDLIPSLIVDRYGDYISLQALSQGTDRLLPVVTELLVDLADPKGIIARNDPRVRLLEGLEQSVDVRHGDIPEKVVVREGRVEYDVDLRHGQKTGAFLDQRENRIAAAQYVSGRTLDCFSYAGGFALQLAPHVDELTALDISEDATALLARNAARNGLTNVHVRTTNVFDELRTLERMGETFDSIVLDPPAFAKSKTAIPKALSGYKEINLRALKLLKPGGFLITCSCSYHVNEAAFAEIILDAALDAKVDVNVVEKRMQGRDHPVVLGMPETYYLKCFILRKLA
ncbi:MAG TPA: class I SAM-dependent rRNA methyltransferase [Vicinamibacterales bacterium]|nr:class I SAM-dependent rRNA methyltransferase [Vicinamibacterales bacterium]